MTSACTGRRWRRSGGNSGWGRQCPGQGRIFRSGPVHRESVHLRCECKGTKVKIRKSKSETFFRGQNAGNLRTSRLENFRKQTHRFKRPVPRLLHPWLPREPEVLRHRVEHLHCHSALERMGRRVDRHVRLQAKDADGQVDALHDWTVIVPDAKKLKTQTSLLQENNWALLRFGMHWTNREWNLT